MDKKKILILQNQIPHYNKALYNGLSKYFDITVLHSGQKTIQKTDKYREIIVFNKKIWKFNFQEEVLKEINSGKYDVVIAMFDIAWVNNILSLFSKKRDIKFIWWGHGYGKNEFGNKIRNFLIKKSDVLILYSDYFVDKFIKNGIDKNKIFIAHNTVEIKNYEFCENCEKNSFLFVGRAQKRKRVDLLLKAFAKIKDKIPKNIMIDIIGDGEENNVLKNLAKELNIENRVIFHGSITDDEKLKPFFHQAYAYVSPGHVGLGVLHSLAYGIPVVTKDGNHHAPEFYNLNEDNSIVYKEDDELENILLKLIQEEKLTYLLGNKGYELYSKDRTIDKMVEGFINAIEGSK